MTIKKPFLLMIAALAIINACKKDSEPTNSSGGKLYGGKTLEELKTADVLAMNGIVPVTKTLVADLMVDVPTLYAHDKAEGIIIINKNMIAICNDDDFGVNGIGTYAAKTLAGNNNEIDNNRIYFIKLKQPL